LKECHEKRDGREIRYAKNGSFEVDFKERGVRVSTFEMRFPKQESESADAMSTTTT
jgi:hypothetical protein